MAGGEFCGNATRSLAYILAKDGVIESEKEEVLSVSGSSDPLRVFVSGNSSRAEMPVNPSTVIKKIDVGQTLVELEGISFLILEPESNIFGKLSSSNDLVDRKDFVLNLIKKHGLDKRLAAGVLGVDNRSDKIKMEPYVFVRDTNTLYYETACGSGSTAVGVLESFRKEGSVNGLEIVQPSGESILVSVKNDDGEFNDASIEGPVEVLFDGNMPLNYKDVNYEFNLGVA